ncbi:MAG: type VII toxin-antitoxin system MntA family adenylyltransferase antitoxin [bacterium]
MKKKDISALKEYFNKREDIAFAFLFGSQAEGRATKLSDVDIAVYFYPSNRKIVEFQEEVYYPGEDEIQAELEAILKREVELLVLNRAPATVSASALNGLPLAIKDWGLYLRFMEVVTSEAIDFRETLIQDFWEREKWKENSKKG